MDQRRSAYPSHPLPPHTPTTTAVSSSSSNSHSNNINNPTDRGPPPPTTTNHYAPGPPGPPPHTHHQQHPHPQTHHHHQQPQYHSQPPGPPPPPPHHNPYQPQPYPGPPTTTLPPPAQGPALPPIQPPGGAYAPPSATTEHHSLPSFRHPTAPPPPPPPPPTHDQRDAHQEHHTHYNHNRSGHGTPAPVNRSYSHDSGQQRSPATPAGPGPGSYPPSSGQDGIPPPAPPPYAMEQHGGHSGYPSTNGIPHGLPHTQAPPPHHDAHSHQMTPIMDQHYQYPPPGQPPMYGAPPNYGPTTANFYGPKRKQMRATQACEQCRQRKQKCDEGAPCSFCKENNLTCQYRDTPPAKTDKNMEKILVHMEAHSRNLETLTNKIESFEARLRKVEDSPQVNHRQHTRDVTVGADRDMSPMEEPPPPTKTHHVDDHRTAPHKLLLLWPSVRKLLTEANVQQNDSYVMEAEDRGVLRIWTRGEGIDEHDGTQPGGPASPARSEESGEGAAATPHADGMWGIGFPTTPSSDMQRSEPNAYEGGLNAQGELDLDVKTMEELYESYIRHLHIMHPFLDRKRLKKMFDSFKGRYGTGRPRAAFAVGREHDADQRATKRQRANGASAGLTNGPESRRSFVQTERSPGNAIVYLVLALGKICMHRRALPGIVPDSKLQLNAEQARLHAAVVRNGGIATSPVIKASPSSPKSTPTTHPTPPSEANSRLAESRSRRQSVEGSPSASPGPRNLDVVPGIAYYAKAAEILGDQGDGNDLVHAQMFLLAALYKGQLARVKESMSWITMAGRAILNLLDRYKLWNKDYWTAYGDKRGMFEQSQFQIKDTRQSLIVLAAWSCLQLESDILAELKLPSSGIQDIEQRLLFPHRMSDDESYREFHPADGRQENYDNILLFFTSQLFLRRRLNMIHRELYGAGTDNSSPAEVVQILQGHEQILHQWRIQLPAALRWNDDDPPPQDILAARLRAKYWGAKFIANRPFLDYALHIMPHLHADPSKKIEEIAKDGHGNYRDKADIKLFNAIRSIGDQEVWLAVERCIQAAMKSTIAFDGVAPRLIVTNIHGTAHAQFGNMLVLTAAYRTSYLRSRIPEEKFRQLLDRTISFLRSLAPISPTCLADCGILEKFRNFLFPAAEEAPEVYRGEGAEWRSSEPMSATNSFNASNN